MRVAVFTSDAQFEANARAAFATAGQVEVVVVALPRVDVLDGVTLVVVDLDTIDQSGLRVLEHSRERGADAMPIVAVTNAISEGATRRLLQLKVSDFLLKPVSPVDLLRACLRATQNGLNGAGNAAQIHTFLAAAGGVGVTTIAIQTALTVLRQSRSENSVCLIDLDFQHGACADYLDLEPRLDLGEIEPRPERLDRQLLEVMLSHHDSGLAVIAAPRRPAEMRSFDPNVVIRLLDLAASSFDNVIIDMPRTWFSWTDNVLAGSDNIFVITEMTVPGLRQVKQLLSVVGERLGDPGKCRVIVNRFHQSLLQPGLRRADLVKALGPTFAGTLPNNYALTREAIDRGVPLDDVKRGNNISTELKKIIQPSSGGADRGEKATGWRLFRSRHKEAAAR
jgi:pilus assembly protein CpaE